MDATCEFGPKTPGPNRKRVSFAEQEDTDFDEILSPLAEQLKKIYLERLSNSNSDSDAILLSMFQECQTMDHTTIVAMNELIRHVGPATADTLQDLAFPEGPAMADALQVFASREGSARAVALQDLPYP